MTHDETISLFDFMKKSCKMTAAVCAYDSEGWAIAVHAWECVFASDTYERVLAGVRRYIHDGGRWWPYPGEVADCMPTADADDEAIRTLRFFTRAQERRESERRAKRLALNPWGESR